METTKKNKDLALKILMNYEDDDDALDEKITFFVRNFKKFLKKRVRGTSSRRQGENEKGKEIIRDLKFKSENTKEKIKYYKYK